ncbi:hypothetical protein OI18_22935 [Flavihumibacter solisilvae]|uniref:Dipeptidylpeptidase IV N-terminal domain-containing protein n=2 Tax=Flavihumibacter solisilvae TaxID=1349421 RepID=A0A0C1L544_9BACT|nr:hypothetical protein OI18_22935 [Flavihumibacter solisilvae]
MFLAFCLAITVYSCSKESETTPKPQPEPNPEPQLTGKIVFSKSFGDTVGVGIYDVDKDSLSIHNLVEPALNPYYVDPKLLFDKSGYFVTVQTGNNQFGLFYASADAKEKKAIQNTELFTVVSPSPDGKKLAIAHPDANGNYQLFQADISGLNKKQLTSFTRPIGKVNVANLCWSNDGTIFFMSNVDTPRANAYSINPATGHLKKIPNSTGKSMFFTSVSKDGKKILYYHSTGTGASEVFSMNVDGSGTRQLTNFGRLTGDAAWSPDGNYVVFSSDFESPKESGYDNLYIITSDGTPVRKITNNTSGYLWYADWK